MRNLVSDLVFAVTLENRRGDLTSRVVHWLDNLTACVWVLRFCIFLVSLRRTTGRCSYVHYFSTDVLSLYWDAFVGSCAILGLVLRGGLGILLLLLHSLDGCD